MARYRLKRKTYGIGDAVSNTLSNTIGGGMEAVGKAADTKLGGLAGAITGIGTLGMMGLGPFGWLASGALGAAAARGIGKGLKTAGQDMQT